MNTPHQSLAAEILGKAFRAALKEVLWTRTGTQVKRDLQVLKAVVADPNFAHLSADDYATGERAMAYVYSYCHLWSLRPQCNMATLVSQACQKYGGVTHHDDE
jgi:hypothetical protein